ncbi:MAG: hypothetical protein ACRDPR_13285 [Nocardioidaceae bacterium]
MRTGTARIVVSCLLATVLAAGMAGQAAADTKVKLDTNNGFTECGRKTVIKSGAITSTEQTVLGPFMISGHQPAVFLDWSRDSLRTFLNCDPAGRSRRSPT